MKIVYYIVTIMFNLKKERNNLKINCMRFVNESYISQSLN